MTARSQAVHADWDDLQLRVSLCASLLCEPSLSRVQLDCNSRKWSQSIAAPKHVNEHGIGHHSRSRTVRDRIPQPRPPLLARVRRRRFSFASTLNTHASATKTSRSRSYIHPAPTDPHWRLARPTHPHAFSAHVQNPSRRRYSSTQTTPTSHARTRLPSRWGCLGTRTASRRTSILRTKMPGNTVAGGTSLESCYLGGRRDSARTSARPSCL